MKHELTKNCISNCKELPSSILHFGCPSFVKISPSKIALAWVQWLTLFVTCIPLCPAVPYVTPCWRQRYRANNFQSGKFPAVWLLFPQMPTATVFENSASITGTAGRLSWRDTCAWQNIINKTWWDGWFVYFLMLLYLLSLFSTPWCRTVLRQP